MTFQPHQAEDTALKPVAPATNRIALEGGKYAVLHTAGTGLRAERYGEPWRDLTGDGLVLAMAQEIESLREAAARPPRFSWVCANGCGACSVKVQDFEYHRSEDLTTGAVESRTIPELVSACCGAGLMLWDNENDREIAVKAA